MNDFGERMNGERHHRDEQKGRKRQDHGAQTFRRGRALEFLHQMLVRRNTLRQQLEAPEYKEIKLIIQGELKAIESVINDYTRHFELHETIEVK